MRQNPLKRSSEAKKETESKKSSVNVKDFFHSSAFSF